MGPLSPSSKTWLVSLVFRVLPRLLGALCQAPHIRPFVMNPDRDQLICSACSRLFATQPALTTHKRGCVASKKRISNAIDGAKSILLARKRMRTAALLNLGISEVRSRIRLKAAKHIVHGIRSDLRRCNQSTSSSVEATQPIVRIPPISPPKVIAHTACRYSCIDTICIRIPLQPRKKSTQHCLR